MAKDKCPDCPPEGAPAWMATFSDLMTLILCFFVLLFSMSSIDAQKLEEVSRAMSSLFNVELGGAPAATAAIDKLTGNGILQLPNAGRGVQESISKEQKDSKDELKKMASDFKTYFADQNVEAQVQVEVNEEEDYIKITFDNQILFDIGKADLKPEAISLLTTLAQELSRYPDNDIGVEGHTDNTPINSLQFPSNWELSAARAIAVAKFYVSDMGFDPRRISAEGFGENRPKYPNDTAENRAKNRRVELKILGDYTSAK